MNVRRREDVSILFKPKFSVDFIPPAPTKSMIAKKPKTDASPWSIDDLTRLVLLRAMNVSYKKIGKLLHRSPATCAWMVHDRMLGEEIKEIQGSLIEGIMSDMGD